MHFVCKNVFTIFPHLSNLGWLAYHQTSPTNSVCKRPNCAKQSSPILVRVLHVCKIMLLLIEHHFLCISLLTSINYNNNLCILHQQQPQLNIFYIYYNNKKKKTHTKNCGEKYSKSLLPIGVRTNDLRIKSL